MDTMKAEEKVSGMLERVLRNLRLAAEAEDAEDREWHIDEAEEMHTEYVGYLQEMMGWLAQRGVSIPLEAQEPTAAVAPVIFTKTATGEAVDV